MAITLKELSAQEERFAPGHRACLGCGETVIVRQVLNAIDGPVVAASPTGCLEIISSPYPYTSWRVPWIHTAFENVASTVSGAEAMYRSLVRQGKIPDRKITFVAFAGDGATYDIGLQFLSGALERGHRFLYVCLNNEAYMNTGIQRSGATPKGAWTTTSPVGKAIPGKKQFPKDMTAIVAAHRIPYVAQASPHAWRDLTAKVQKAVAADGPTFINVLAPCPRGWRYEAQDTVTLARLAVDTCVWPIYEIVNGQWTLSYKPAQKKPIIEWVKSQGRFAHLLRPENKALLEELQERVDQDWDAIQKKAAAPAP